MFLDFDEYNVKPSLGVLKGREIDMKTVKNSEPTDRSFPLLAIFVAKSILAPFLRVFQTNSFYDPPQFPPHPSVHGPSAPTCPLL